jgi:hypothetical protein
MASRSQKTYQDPGTAGSLSSALRQWRSLCARRRETATTHITFALSCWGESRATRVAGFLRRRRACAVTLLRRVAGTRRDTWQVHGSTHSAIHSLADLEATWTWLSHAARSHQVVLLRVTVAPTAA